MSNARFDRFWEAGRERNCRIGVKMRKYRLTTRSALRVQDEGDVEKGNGEAENVTEDT